VVFANDDNSHFQRAVIQEDGDRISPPEQISQLARRTIPNWKSVDRPISGSHHFLQESPRRRPSCRGS